MVSSVALALCGPLCWQRNKAISISPKTLSDLLQHHCAKAKFQKQGQYAAK